MRLKKINFVILAFLFMPIVSFPQEIFTAITQGNFNKAKELIDADQANASLKNQRGFSPIHFAANFNQLEIAKLLIDHGADPFVEDLFGRQATHWAAAAGCTQILKWLNSLGADLNLADSTNNTALSLAVAGKHKETVDYLLSQHVLIPINGKQGFNLLFSSLIENIESVINKFIQSDFDFTQVSAIGSSLLIAAVEGGNPDLIDTLVKKGVDINKQNDFGDFPLLLSVKKQKLEVMKKLIELGADINLKNFVGQNALNLAELEHAEEYVNILKQHGAKGPEKYSLSNQYPDIKKPGLTPELLAPGIISTPDFEERDVMFSPDMKEFYFTRYSRTTRMPMTVNRMGKTKGEWSMPEKADFSGKFNTAESFIDFDNKTIYFISQRPANGGDKPSTWEIWEANRTNNGWENTRLFDTTQLKGCFYPSLTKKGELLYTSPGNDIFLAKLVNGRVENPQKLGPEINTADAEYNAMISPNGDYIIFTSHGFPDHYGNGDLYISFRDKDGNWGTALNMGPSINSEALEYCPNISPDGKYFFFTSNKKGTEDIYWVDAKIIDQLRNKK